MIHCGKLEGALPLLATLNWHPQHNTRTRVPLQLVAHMQLVPLCLAESWKYQVMGST